VNTSVDDILYGKGKTRKPEAGTLCIHKVAEAGEKANTWSFRKTGARRREEGSRDFSTEKYL
jgi:hypothetical protein